MAPPEGVVADLNNPTDVLRTINFVTQALTLVLCSVFVFIRGAQKLRMASPTFVVDDCRLENCSRRMRCTDSILPDLTVLSWLFMVAFCVSVTFSMYTEAIEDTGLIPIITD